eukprot:14655842-Alexandrium_andersonii.AAC.1
MAGGTGIEAPSGPADITVVAGSARTTTPPAAVSVGGNRELVRSAEAFVGQLVATAGERGERA